MSRYIDVEWIRNVYADFEHYENRDDWTTPIANVLAVIDDAPSIDLVRCAECKRVREDGGHANCSGYLYCRKWKTLVDEDSYCSWGERSEP